MNKIVSITESKAFAELFIGIGPALISHLSRHLIVKPSKESNDVVIADNQDDLDSVIDRAKDHETWFYYCVFSLLFCVTESLLPEQKMIGIGLVVASIFLTALDFFNIVNVYDYINFIVPDSAITATKDSKGVAVQITSSAYVLGYIDSFYWIPSLFSLVLAILPISVGLLYDPGFETPGYQLVLKSAFCISAVTLVLYLLLKLTCVVKKWVNVLTAIKKADIAPSKADVHVHHEHVHHEHIQTPHKVSAVSNIVFINGKSDIVGMQHALNNVRIAWTGLYVFAFISCFLLNFSVISDENKIIIKNGLIGIFGLWLCLEFHFFGSHKSEKVHN